MNVQFIRIAALERPSQDLPRIPVDSNARWLIGAYGLHNRVQCDMKLNSRPSPYIMKIVSGGRTPGEEPRVNPGELTYRVATLAERVFKDDRFADQLHSALNEASDNVIGHAYEELDGVDAAAGRWWVFQRVAAAKPYQVIEFGRTDCEAANIDRDVWLGVPVARKQTKSVGHEHAAAGIDARGEGSVDLARVEPALGVGSVHVSGGRLRFDHKDRERVLVYAEVGDVADLALGALTDVSRRNTFLAADVA